MPLLTSVDCTQHVHLIVGDNGIAAKRAMRSLEAGATCILVSPTKVADLPFDLTCLLEKDRERIRHVQREFEESDLTSLGREEVDRVVDMVFVTLSPLDKKGTFSLGRGILILVIWISSLCKRLRIPVNCADSPSNCTFSLLSTHRDGPIQIGVSTSGKVSFPRLSLFISKLTFRDVNSPPVSAVK